MNFLVLIQRIEQFYFLILMFKLQISHIKQNFMILRMFFGKFRKFSKKSYTLCLYKKCTPNKLQMIENRQKLSLNSATQKLCKKKF